MKCMKSLGMMRMYDSEEKALFFVATLFGVTIDRAYEWRVVRVFMMLSARVGGISVRRPR